MGPTSDIAAGFERAERRAVSVRAESGAWTATGREPQVFLDRTGRRARRVSVAGVLAVVVGAGWLGGVVGGSAGFASLPALRAPLVAHAVSHGGARRGHAHRHHTHTVEVAEVASPRG